MKEKWFNGRKYTYSKGLGRYRLYYPEDANSRDSCATTALPSFLIMGNY
jgi:hypothetical protein